MGDVLPYTRCTVHACLVSAQPTPNLTPVLDERFRPERVILLVSPDMQERAGWLAEVMGSYGVKVKMRDIPDPYNLGDLREKIMALVAENESESIALNVTGGTKLMAIAAYEVFGELNRPVFYVHPERDRLIWLHPKRQAVDLSDRVKIENFLRVHGFRVAERLNRAAISAAWRDITRHLIQGIEKFGKPLGTLNWLASTAEDTRLSMPIEAGKLAWPDFMELVRVFGDAQLLELRDDRLYFPDDASRFFVNGGWLEHHVREVVESLRSELGIQDAAQGVKVCSIRACSVENELDVMFLSDNRLHLIECKTARFDNPDKPRADQALYKLDTLKGLGGLQARCLLVSFRDLPEADRRRAGDMGIRTVVGPEIRNLKKFLSDWVGIS